MSVKSNEFDDLGLPMYNLIYTEEKLRRNITDRDITKYGKIEDIIDKESENGYQYKLGNTYIKLRTFDTNIIKHYYDSDGKELHSSEPIEYRYDINNEVLHHIGYNNDSIYRIINTGGVDIFNLLLYNRYRTSRAGMVGYTKFNDNEDYQLYSVEAYCDMPTGRFDNILKYTEKIRNLDNIYRLIYSDKIPENFNFLKDLVLKNRKGINEFGRIGAWSLREMMVTVKSDLIRELIFTFKDDELFEIVAKTEPTNSESIYIGSGMYIIYPLESFGAKYLNSDMVISSKLYDELVRLGIYSEAELFANAL